MTQVSRFWDGTSVGDATAAPYDAATEFARVMQSVSGAGGIATNQSAVFRGELNELAVTGAASPVSINTGRAIVAGTWYENDAATTVAIPTPAVSTRIDRIVLRKDWSASVQTVRVTRIAGVEGGAAPALVQNWGVMWDAPLAQVSITTGAVITLTDQRQFVGSNPLSNLSSFAVGDLLYANTTTTLARLADIATGSVLVSGGVGVAPLWSNSPTLTGLTTTGAVSVGSTLTVTSTINGQTISATANFTGSVAIGTTLAVTGVVTGAATSGNKFGSGAAVSGHVLSASLGTSDDVTYRLLGLGGGGNNGYGSLARYTTTAVTVAKQIALLDTRAAIVLVSGTDGTNYFTDLVIAGYDGLAAAVSSQTESGTPAVRTYSNPGSGVLKVAMASGTYRISTLVIQIQER